MKKYLVIGGAVLVIFILIIASILLVGNQGGGRQNQEQIELVWWKTFQDSNQMNTLIEQYQKARPNVTIKYTKKSITDYETDLLNAFASGNAPDIFTIHNDWLPKHMDKMAPMPNALMTERQYRDTFVDVAADDFVKDGKIYGVPLSVDVMALFYNKDILGSAGIFNPPVTWRDVVSASQKITRQDNSGNFVRSGIALGTSNNVNRAADAIMLLMLQQGAIFYNEDFTSAQFDRPIRADNQNINPGAMALDFYTQFARPSNKAYTWNSKADNSVDAFAQGKLGMMLSYSYMLPTIKDKAPNLNWGVVPVPQIDTTGLKVNFANYWGEAVSKNSKNQEYAWDFLNFITQAEALGPYLETVNAPAPRRDLLSTQANDVELGVFAESALTAKSVYKSDAAKFESIFLKMIDDVVLRNFDPDNAVTDAVSQVNQILRED
jgi:multiple sugar transport system substrate-binding protein